MSGQTPSSPSWSVPLHRPPPGVVYDQSPTPAGMPGPSYPYPSGQYEGYDDPSGSVNGNGNGTGWYPPGDGYTGYPPGPSSYQAQMPRKDTMGSTGRLSFSTQPEVESKTPVGGAGTGPKKKRKQSNAETDKEKDKRTKTGRACDACVCPLFAPCPFDICLKRGEGMGANRQRTKKIRCDILSPEEALGREALCAHCKQYSLECTFFLPITETRFKKKKQAGEFLQQQ